jgi:hypothetical protein
MAWDWSPRAKRSKYVVQHSFGNQTEWTNGYGPCPLTRAVELMLRDQQYISDWKAAGMTGWPDRMEWRVVDLQGNLVDPVRIARATRDLRRSNR